MSSHVASDLFSINNGSLCTMCTLQAYSVFGNQTQQHKVIYVHLTSVHPICQQWHFTLARMVLLLILHFQRSASASIPSSISNMTVPMPYAMVKSWII